MIRQAEEDLKALEVRQDERDALLDPMRALLKDMSFWIHQSSGLVLYSGRDFFQTYRLPLPFEELVVTGHRFHVKPLLPMFSGDGRFYILSLSQHRVRLFLGSHYNLEEIELKETPTTIGQALWADDGESKESHPFFNERPARGGRNDSMHQSHGADAEDTKARPHDEIVRFFQKVQDGLMAEVFHLENAPLVLAGVEYYLPIYREVNHYQHLVGNAIIAGNHDRTNAQELHEKAWNIVAPIFSEKFDRSKERYGNLRARDGMAIEGLAKVIPASVYQQVEVLFVDDKKHQWGQFDMDTNTLTLHEEEHPGDEDLLDLAAVQTLLGGGTVHTLPSDQMPSNELVAAILRYPADIEVTVKEEASAA